MSRQFVPDLAHLMGWHWDESSKEEVCYFANGKEIIRYMPSTGKYTYFRLCQIPVDGRHAFFAVMASSVSWASVASTSAVQSNVQSSSPSTGRYALSARLEAPFTGEMVPDHQQDISVDTPLSLHAPYRN